MFDFDNNLHRHTCACGHSWEHTRSSVHNDDEDVAAHTCTECGAEVRDVGAWQCWVDGQAPTGFFLMLELFSVRASD